MARLIWTGSEPRLRPETAGKLVLQHSRLYRRARAARFGKGYALRRCNALGSVQNGNAEALSVTRRGFQLPVASPGEALPKTWHRCALGNCASDQREG